MTLPLRVCGRFWSNSISFGATRTEPAAAEGDQLAAQVLARVDSRAAA